MLKFPDYKPDFSAEKFWPVREYKQTVNTCQQKCSRFVVTMEKTTFGQRLKTAFGNASNAEIARKIGVSPQAVVNYVGGRIPDLDKLLQVKATTNCDLDWLLTGEEKTNREVVELNPELQRRVKQIASEQAHTVFEDVQIAAGNLDDLTVRLLTEYLIARALKSLNLIADESDVMDGSDLKRAEKFSFVRNLPPTLDQFVKQLVSEQLRTQTETPVQELGTVDEFDVRAAVERYDDPYLVMRDWYAHDKLNYMPDVIDASGWEGLSVEEKVQQLTGLRRIQDRQEERRRNAPRFIKKRA